MPWLEWLSDHGHSGLLRSPAALEAVARQAHRNQVELGVPTDAGSSITRDGLRGEVVHQNCHRRVPPSVSTLDWLRGQDSNLRLPGYEPGGLSELSYRALGLNLVGMTRFERATSWTQTRRAPQVAPHPARTDGRTRTPALRIWNPPLSLLSYIRSAFAWSRQRDSNSLPLVWKTNVQSSYTLPAC